MAGSERAIGGAAAAKIGGRQVALRGAFKYSTQRDVKTVVRGQDATTHGYTTKPRAPFVEMEVSHVKGWTVRDYEEINGQTVVVDLNNGKTVTLTNSVVVGEIDIDHEEGKTTIRLEGDEGEEV